MSIKFIHIRHKQIELTDHGIEQTFFPNGGATFAYEVREDKVFYALAQCSLNDAYSRKHGRLIAGGRLEKGKGVRSFPHDPSRRLADQVIEHDNETYAEWRKEN